MASESGEKSPENGDRSLLVIFPALAALISLVCAAVIARDAWIRPRPDKIAWAIAFGIFTVAAGIEVFASLTEWTANLARIYYLTGAVLVVGYLALGELYLLAGARIARFAPGVTLLITAISATIVLNAPVDETRLAADGWDAIERGTALTAIALTINIGGTFVLAGGLIYSAIRFKRLGIQRNRMIGCLLIAVGTTVVGMGGTVTRLGADEYLYIAMATGVSIIFAGYLQARRPDSAKLDPVPKTEGEPSMVPTPVSVTANGSNSTNGNHPVPSPHANPGIALIEQRLATEDHIGLARFCAEWSAETREISVLDREDARRAWTLRIQLSEKSQATFDQLPPSSKRQLAEVYHEVFAIQTITLKL